MGSGHDTSAAELARRLTARGDVTRTVDLLRLLPLGLGSAIRGFYAGMLQRTPWLYDVIYRQFLDRDPDDRLGPDPVARAAEPRLRRIVAAERPDAVVPLWHVAAEATGRMRAAGVLAAPVTVVVTELVVHQAWVHPGNDRHVCLHPSAVDEAASRGAADPVLAAPLIPQRFLAGDLDSAPPPDVADRLDGRLPVLVTAGGWGTGDLRQTARAIARSGRYAAVVLCGRNARLRATLTAEHGVVALGWRDDVRRLVASASAVVQNGGGLACWEALSVGRPVVTFRPLPGHGRAAGERLAATGLAPLARDAGELVARLDAVTAASAAATPRLDLAAMPDAADQVLG
jgi:UDP-N-acetylglucosamine:LPS N-acetylglucosamine transferase